MISELNFLLIWGYYQAILEALISLEKSLTQSFNHKAHVLLSS